MEIKQKFIVIKGNNLSYIVMARAQRYVNLNGSKTWGKTTFSAKIESTNEWVTPAKCSKATLLSQLNIIDEKAHLFI